MCKTIGDRSDLATRCDLSAVHRPIIRKMLPTHEESNIGIPHSDLLRRTPLFSVGAATDPLL